MLGCVSHSWRNEELTRQPGSQTGRFCCSRVAEGKAGIHGREVQRFVPLGFSPAAGGRGISRSKPWQHTAWQRCMLLSRALPRRTLRAIPIEPLFTHHQLAQVKQSHDDALGGPPTSSRIHRGGGGEGVGITDGVGGSTARGSYREGYSHGSAAGATGNHSNAGASYLRQSLSSSQGARGAGAASGSSTARGGQLGTPGRQPQYGAAEGSSYAVRSSLSYQNTVGGGGGGGGSASASQALLAAQLSSQRAVLTSSHGRSGGHGAAGSGAGAGAGAGAGQGVGSSAANIAAAAAAAAAVSLQAQQQYAHALATPRGHYGSTAASASHMHLSGSGAPASGATQAAAAAAAAGTGAIQGSRAAYQAAGAPPTTSASTAQRHQQLTQQPEQHRRRESSGAEAAAVAVSTAALAHSASGYGARPPVGAAAAAAAAAHYTASGNTTSAANAASGAAATATHTSTATAAASSTAAATAAAATTATAAAVTWESGYITPAQALSRYAEYMTPYEHSEVLEYQQVGEGGAHTKADTAARREGALCGGAGRGASVGASGILTRFVCGRTFAMGSVAAADRAVSTARGNCPVRRNTALTFQPPTAHGALHPPALASTRPPAGVLCGPLLRPEGERQPARRRPLQLRLRR